jgi:hypothetical protein
MLTRGYLHFSEQSPNGPSVFLTRMRALRVGGVMARKTTLAPSIKTSNVAKSEKVACPSCAASLVIYRSDSPQIDECGFESYSLTCRACGSALVGIVDPLDDRLLLTLSS